MSDKIRSFEEGAYPILYPDEPQQCTCGFRSTVGSKPQSQWTDEETKREVEHQKRHLPGYTQYTGYRP